ncbi:MAG: hypothetical protein ACRCWR_03110, partial [Saezia sp.]
QFEDYKRPEGVKPIQTGGHTVEQNSANELNRHFNKDLHSREWGDKLEALKEANRLGNDHHGKLWSNGDYTDMNGKLIGNISKL